MNVDTSYDVFHESDTVDEENRKNLQAEYLNRRWKVTDFSSIILFALVFLTWIYAVAYACLAVGDNELTYGFSDVFRRNEMFMDFPYSKLSISINVIDGLIKSYFHSSFYGIISVIKVSAVIAIAIVYLISMDYFPKLYACIGIIFRATITALMAYCSYNIVSIYRYRTTFSTVFGMLLLTLLVLMIFYFIVSIVCIANVSIEIVANIVMKASRTFFCFKNLILFGTFIYALQVSVVLLSLVSLTSFDPKDRMLCLVLLQTLYLISFIHYFGKTIINHAVATWYWMENKEAIPKTVLFQSIASITRYHFGSVAFGAMHILPFFVCLISCCQILRKCNSAFNVVLAFFLVLNVTDYVWIVSSSYGKNFYQDARDAVRILTRKSLLSLSIPSILGDVILASFLVILLVASIFFVVLTFFSIMLLDTAQLQNTIHLAVFIPMISISVVLLPILITAKPVANLISFSVL